VNAGPQGITFGNVNADRQRGQLGDQWKLWQARRHYPEHLRDSSPDIVDSMLPIADNGNHPIGSAATVNSSVVPSRPARVRDQDRAWVLRGGGGGGLTGVNLTPGDHGENGGICRSPRGRFGATREFAVLYALSGGGSLIYNFPSAGVTQALARYGPERDATFSPITARTGKPRDLRSFDANRWGDGQFCRDSGRNRRFFIRPKPDRRRWLEA